MWNSHSLKWHETVTGIVKWLVGNDVVKPGDLPLPLRESWWPVCRAAAPLAPWAWRAIKLKRKIFKT
jgi:hypothetical protein